MSSFSSIDNISRSSSEQCQRASQGFNYPKAIGITLVVVGLLAMVAGFIPGVPGDPSAWVGVGVAAIVFGVKIWMFSAKSAPIVDDESGRTTCVSNRSISRKNGPTIPPNRPTNPQDEPTSFASKRNSETQSISKHSELNDTTDLWITEGDGKDDDFRPNEKDWLAP